MERKRGRPRQFEDLVHVSVSVTREDYEAARKLGLNLSETLREAIRRKAGSETEKQLKPGAGLSAQVVKPELLNRRVAGLQPAA